MKILLRTLALFIWLACGHISACYWRGFLYHRYPDQNNNSQIVSYIGGPFSLVATGMVGNFKYYEPQRHSCQQRWEAFQKKAAILGKDYFVGWGNNDDCEVMDLQ